MNDETGAPAYDPAILPKVIRQACLRGVTCSGDIALPDREISTQRLISISSCT
jgi:hypothetical protein